MNSLFDGAKKVPVADVAIVGAGASGLACAVQCAKTLRKSGQKDARIVVLEVSSKPGRSILASGNGRCNFSNARLASDADRSMYWNGAFASDAAESLRASAEVGTLSWLRTLGLVWGTPSEDGLLYPYSNKAVTVLGVLLSACRRWGVEIVPDVRIDKVRARKGRESRFVLEGERGVETSRSTTPGGRLKRKLAWEPCAIEARRVVVATGGVPSCDLVPGHELVPACPVLAPMKATSICPLGSLDGVRAKAGLTVHRGDEVVFSEVGEVLFRSYGISGIVTFNASRHYSDGSTFYLDFAPDYQERDLFDLLSFIASSVDSGDISDVLSGMFVPEIVDFFVHVADQALSAVSSGFVKDDKESGDKELGNEELSHKEPNNKEPKSLENRLRLLVALIKNLPLTVAGVSDAVPPQVHRGGVDVSQVNPATLESLVDEGLYILGEALDVDGPCGGYNLDWAWTCGILAGTHIATKLSSDD